MSETKGYPEQYVDVSGPTTPSGPVTSGADAATAMPDAAQNALRPYWVRLDIEVPLEFE